MAARLALQFYDSASNVINFSYNYANQSATTANVKALMSGIVSNGSIFSRVPVSQKSAKLLITNETEYDLSA